MSVGDVHPLLVPLMGLVGDGEWLGYGEGSYPAREGRPGGVPAFRYVERVTFAPVPGKPVVAYSSTTKAAPEDESCTMFAKPMHSESGFLRALPGGEYELVVAQSTGVGETCRGSVAVATGGASHPSLELASTHLTGAEVVTQTARAFRRVGGGAGEGGGPELHVTLSMAAGGLPLTPHLASKLIPKTDPEAQALRCIYQF